MPAVSTRRRFLSRAAGVAAGGAVLALATIPPASAADVSDPVFDLIASHKKITGTVNAIAAEINRAVEIDEQTALEQGAFSEQNSVEFDLFSS